MQMPPTSHAIPINSLEPSALRDPGMLADAFSDFIAASVKLETSYRDLQAEVADLNLKVAERNAALMKSLSENDRMRTALQQIIDSMPCGVLVLNTVGALVMINPESRRLLDIGSVPVANLGQLSAAHGLDLTLIEKAADDLDNEVCLSFPSGKRWLAISKRKLTYTPLRQNIEDHAAMLQSIWILRDITANKQAEEERERARNAMALAEISTILAHEIRNPLASMELFADLIAQDPNSNLEWVSHLRAGIRQLAGTVNNVLGTYSGAAIDLMPVDLTACLNEGMNFVDPILQQASVHLSFLPCEAPLMVLGNEDAIRQIILNLISNAVRHTSSGGKITVSIRVVAANMGKRAFVEVADTGCGVPDSLMERLFEPGFSVSGDTPGLGLAVCKRLMEQHRGEIHVTSRVDIGTSFQLEFPAL